MYNPMKIKPKIFTVDKDAEQVAALEEQLQACQAAQQEWKDKYLRLNADLENFR